MEVTTDQCDLCGSANLEACGVEKQVIEELPPPPNISGPSVLAYGKDRQVIKFQKLFQSAKRPCLTCNLPIYKNLHDDHIKSFGLKKVLTQGLKKTYAHSTK